MTKQELQNNILNKSYNRDKWQAVLKRFFGATKLHQQPPAILLTANDIAESAVELGGFYTKDERQIGIYEITLKPNANTNIAINRIGLRNLLRNVYKYEVDGALIVFVQGNKWRFSYVSEIRTEEGKKETEPKRYTYLFGEGESCRTASDRFSKLLDKKYYIQDLYEAFSVEKLNKDFFKTYKEFYQKGVEHLIKNEKYYKLLIDKSELNDIVKQEKPVRDFVKKLLGRIVFLHFLQKKEWLGCPLQKTEKENEAIWKDGSKRFMMDLFQQFENTEKFHSECLSVLFFSTLNKKRKNNIFEISFLHPKSNKKEIVRIPYLNGGLFETDLLDKKTKQPVEALIDFPVDYFSKLLDFFEQFNFTIDENDPYDNEVGIDPEMLGHIFENLLEDNKDRGAFYTPKEIVHFMCQESLIEYIKTNKVSFKIKDEIEFNNAIEDLIRNHHIDDLFVKKENAVFIDTLLKNVKICDPAIGSGAFPMGMLKELFECRRILYPYLKTNEDFIPSKLKKDIIQNNIYGVDVENGAVDIARLRFWLALVVDELIPEPLPNLDYKIMQGNSLLEQFENVPLKFEKKKYISQIVKETDLFGNIVNPQVSITEFLQTKEAIHEFNITELEEVYFKSSNPIEKKEIRDKIESFEKEFIKEEVNKQLKTLNDKIKKNILIVDELETISTQDFSAKTKGASTKYANALINIERKKNEIEKSKLEKERISNRLKELLDKSNNNSNPYFLWHLYFMDVFTHGGFDIVIGNPPYIQLQKMGLDSNDLEKGGFKTFSKTSDIYCLFYEQGINLLKANGVLTYITSNSWMKTKYGELLRKYFVENTDPICIINFEDSKIFQTATVETNILISKKESYKKQTSAVAVKQDYALNSSILEYKINNEIILNELSNTEWIILSYNDFVIKKRIEECTNTIKSLQYEINIGVNTGLNEVYIINEEKKNELISLDKKNASLLVPTIKGRDLKKYNYSFSNNYLINVHNGIKLKKIKPINAEIDYPSIFSYFKTNEAKILNRWDKGHYWYNLRNCAYLEDFTKPKIIWGELSDKPKFAFDDKGLMTDATVFIMTGNLLKVILIILNSKICEWYFETYTTTSGMGTNRWKKYKIEQIPIPQIEDKKLIAKFETLADYLIYLNDNATPPINAYADNASLAGVFEDVANMMVYELYFKEHMQQLGLDILNESEWDKYFKPIINIKDQLQQAKIIGDCYTWLQKQDNPIRNKIILSNVKSKDIIRRINATTH